MNKQLLKRGSIVVASALTIFGLSVASPSMAATVKHGHVAAASKKAAVTATPAPTSTAAPTTGGNLDWGTGAGAGSTGDDANEGPEKHGEGHDGKHGKGHDGKHGKGHDGKRDGKGPKGGPANLTDQTATVNVPADSSVYVAVITEVLPAAPAPAPATGSVATPVAPPHPAHTITVPVSGVGSQTVTFKGIAGQAYTVQLVKVVATQVVTGK
ncbi:MAG: hypothetical protein RLZZ626_302 [Actinomycetota bacterium]